MKLSTYDNPSQWLSSSQTSRICSAHYRDQLSPGKLSDKWLFNFLIFLNSNCRVFEVLSIAKVSPVSFTGDIVALEFKETFLSFWQTTAWNSCCGCENKSLQCRKIWTCASPQWLDSNHRLCWQILNLVSTCFLLYKMEKKRFHN